MEIVNARYKKVNIMNLRAEFARRRDNSIKTYSAFARELSLHLVYETKMAS